MLVKLRKSPSNNMKYNTVAVTIPKEILRKAPKFRRQKYVEIEVDVLGHIVIKPQ